MDYSTYLQEYYRKLEARERMPISGQKPLPNAELELFIDQLKDLITENQERVAA